METRYQPIENYGLIGNMRTAALVGMDGSIDWLCLPHFDSPSVFAAILDNQKGGRFRIVPACEQLRHKQFYWPDANILVTRFLHADGIGQIEDYMPVDGAERARDKLIRRVRVVRGTMPFRMECRPAFDYARADHECHVLERLAVFCGGGLRLGLASPFSLTRDGGGVFAEFTLSEGENATFVLQQLKADDLPKCCPCAAESEELFRATVNYWRRWLSKCTYRGRWREMVHRSALTLKLLTSESTGAIVAAPTCSLPEAIGGGRNWDYRYTWIRDAAFTLYALLRIGFTEEAAAFKQWAQARWKEFESAGDGPLQLMYAIDGRSELAEETLDHLEGYRGSRPVRIGNGAYRQLQLDIYGELMDAAYLNNKYVEPIGYDSWRRLRQLVDWLCDNWRREDEGIWEVRGGRRHFVYSKFMSWVALDRGLRLAEKRSFPADRQRWLKVRDEIYEEVMAKGWSDSRQAFVQSYGSDALDASMLLMPLTFFMAPNDPRMLSTIDAIRRQMTVGGLAADGLIRRYDPRAAVDGFADDEGTFLVATADGKGVPMRRPLAERIHGSHPRRGKGEKANKKQMAYVGAVYSIDRFRRTADDVVDEVRRKRRAADRPSPRHKQVRAEMTRAVEGEGCTGRERIFAEMAMACRERNPQRRLPLVCLMDGERALWEVAREWLPRAVGILDLFHVLERLWQAADCFHAERSSEAEAFVTHRLQMLLEGKAGYVIGGLKRLRDEHGLQGEKRKTLNAAIQYYENNREHMKYDKYLAAGYPIGSGVAEGACRHLVKDRLECTGMRWTVNGAQAVLHLRAIYLNGCWDNFVNDRIETEQTRLYRRSAA